MIEYCEAKTMQMPAERRGSFEEAAVELLARSVRSSVAFCSFGHNLPTRAPVVRRSERVAETTDPAVLLLLRARGLNETAICNSARCLYSPHELWPHEPTALLTIHEPRASPILAATASPDAACAVGPAEDESRSIVIVIHDQRHISGLAGLERGSAEPPFSPADCAALEAVTPCLLTIAQAQVSLEAQRDELDALRAMCQVEGVILMVDARESSAVPLVASSDQPDVTVERLRLVGDAARRLFDQGHIGALCPLPVPLAAATILRIAPLSQSSSERRVALHVIFEGRRAADGLSRREREIARMLVSGYSAVNIAATYDLSENTVRTYMRRLYRKLAVNNRADLVRQLVAPDWRPEAQPVRAVATGPDRSTQRCNVDEANATALEPAAE